MTTKMKKGLGRGLSALIPDADMDFLSRVARGEIGSAPIKDAAPPSPVESPSDAKEAKRGRFRGVAGVQDQASEVVEVFSSSNEPETPPKPADTLLSDAGVQRVALDTIEANPYQPRRTFHQGELEDLAASIREHGVLQPLLVRPSNGTKPYQLVAGERRWRAARLAGLEQVPVIVREVGDQQALELALIENVQRHDISPLDAALAYKRLSSEFGLSQEKISLRVGKGRVAIANTMRLLDLPEEAQRALEDGMLSEGHGRAILQAESEGARRAVFRRIIRDRLSVRDAEHIARATTASGEGEGAPSNAKAVSKAKASIKTATDDLQRAEKQLQRRLGARLQIRPRAKGGQIIINYADAGDFERLFSLLGGSQSSST